MNPAGEFDSVQNSFFQLSRIQKIKNDFFELLSEAQGNLTVPKNTRKSDRVPTKNNYNLLPQLGLISQLMCLELVHLNACNKKGTIIKTPCNLQGGK